mgnify:CR=1 FL=1
MKTAKTDCKLFGYIVKKYSYIFGEICNFPRYFEILVTDNQLFPMTQWQTGRKFSFYAKSTISFVHLIAYHMDLNVSDDLLEILFLNIIKVFSQRKIL